jgi:hypothetical protein
VAEADATVFGDIRNVTEGDVTVFPDIRNVTEGRRYAERRGGGKAASEAEARPLPSSTLGLAAPGEKI